MTSATKPGQSRWTPPRFLSDPHSDAGFHSEAGDGREHLPSGSDREKVSSDPGATLWGMVETVAHFPANDWGDVITFKTLCLKRTPGTPLSALSCNFVLDKEERLRERERGVGRLNRQLWTRGVSKHRASQKSQRHQEAEGERPSLAPRAPH